jgi:CheY-like chemotaxis protein
MNPQSVSSASSALDQLQRRSLAGTSISLLLTDVHMPEMDGLMLVEQIRRNAGLADLRVIVLTSGDGSRDADHWKQLDVTALLIKPVKQSELLAAIENALSTGKQVVSRQSTDKPTEELPLIPPLKILLAEDGLTNQKFAVALLQRSGHQVMVANDGREALRAYENQTFDLVLMDVQMPEMDGLEATTAIRAVEKKLGRRTPIVAMTARVMPGDREQCLQAGMDGYVSKPIRQLELYREIASFFKVHSENGPPPALVDWSNLLEAVENDREAACELIDLFRLEASDLAAELARAATGRRAEAAAQISHKLKGTLKIFGVVSLVSLVARIEDLSAIDDWDGIAPALAELRTKLGKLNEELNDFQRSPAGQRES